MISREMYEYKSQRLAHILIQKIMVLSLKNQHPEIHTQLNNLLAEYLEETIELEGECVVDED